MNWRSSSFTVIAKTIMQQII
ncbi:hypothetical protein LINGRAHAP2_LOCUS19587 [Linum grandiflorum]